MEFGLLSAGRPDSSYCNYGSISIPKKLTNDVSKAARFALMMMEGLIGAVLPPDSTICDQRGKRVTSQKHLAIVPVSKPNLLSILLGSLLRFEKRLGVWTMLLHLFGGVTQSYKQRQPQPTTVLTTTILTILTILTIYTQVKNDELCCIINNISIQAQQSSSTTIYFAGFYAYPGSVNDGLPLPNST